MSARAERCQHAIGAIFDDLDPTLDDDVDVAAAPPLSSDLLPGWKMFCWRVVVDRPVARRQR
jgi:hypothetical protein